MVAGHLVRSLDCAVSCSLKRVIFSRPIRISSPVGRHGRFRSRAMHAHQINGIGRIRRIVPEFPNRGARRSRHTNSSIRLGQRLATGIQAIKRVWHPRRSPPICYNHRNSAISECRNIRGKIYANNILGLATCRRSPQLPRDTLFLLLGAAIAIRVA
jgi:hypothetical protein